MKQSMIVIAMCALTALAYGANSWYANAANAAGTNAADGVALARCAQIVGTCISIW